MQQEKKKPRNTKGITATELQRMHDSSPRSSQPSAPVGLLYLGSLVGRRHLRLPSFLMTTHALARHLDLLLVALLYGCLFSGALLVATSLVLLLLLAGALLAALALAASDACGLVAPAARAVDAAAANLRLARAVAVYAVLGAAVRAAVALRPWIGALASRVGYVTWWIRCGELSVSPW